jgi:hypothetical protein
VIGPIAIPDLIGRELTDERELSLAREPAYLARHERDDGEVLFAVVLGAPLVRRTLMDLLYVLAPYKAHGPDRFARVIDNWHLHDRALTSSGSENLLRQHAKSLKFSWHEFARHRQLFISMFEDSSESVRVLPVVTWVKNQAGTRRWEFGALDAALLRLLQASVPILRDDQAPRLQLNSLLGLVTIPYFSPELHKNWRAWQPLEKNGKSNYIGPASVPVVALMHRRALLTSAFVKAAEARIDSAEPLKLN